MSGSSRNREPNSSAGNRTIWQRVETGKDEATYYTYDDADELTQHMKADVYTYFTYDNDGNQTSKKVGESLCYYNYDPDNMLTTFTEGETDAEYVYDASPGIRRRVKAVVDGAVTYYAFDGLNVLADYDGDVSAQRTFVVPFLDDSLVLRTGGNDYHYTLDALGSVANLVDGNEAVQNDYLYEAFGSAHGTPTQNVTNRLRFTGREWDPTLSLYQYRARWCAPTLGAFCQRDPLRDELGRSGYVYAGSQPADYNDPLGWKYCCTCWKRVHEIMDMDPWECANAMLGDTWFETAAEEVRSPEWSPLNDVQREAIGATVGELLQAGAEMGLEKGAATCIHRAHQNWGRAGGLTRWGRPEAAIRAAKMRGSSYYRVGKLARGGGRAIAVAGTAITVASEGWWLSKRLAAYNALRECLKEVCQGGYPAQECEETFLAVFHRTVYSCPRGGDLVDSLSATRYSS